MSAYSADSLIERANQLHDSGQYHEAIAMLNKVVITDPSYSTACYELALNYYSLGDYNLALTFCNKAEFLQYDHPFLYSLKGSILNVSGRTNEGIAVINSALRKWPCNQNLLYNLGLCYLTAGKPDTAEQMLLRSVVFYPYHTRSHLAIAKANLAMGRIAESYLAYNMAILINPSTYTIMEMENAIGGKSDILPRAYLYPYSPEFQQGKWKDIKYLLQSELAFSKEFDYPYDLDFTFTRQSLMLFRSLRYDRSDTSVYNRLYTRLFQEIYEKDMFETYINYCMNNMGSTTASDWNRKNPGKIDAFIQWAQQFINQGRVYAFRADYEQKRTEIHHFDENGTLTSIGSQNADDGKKNGPFYMVSNNGGVTEHGTYSNDLTQGEWFIYWPDGTIKQHLHFENDNLNDTARTYHPNGAKAYVYPFRDGLKQGKTAEYTGAGFLSVSSTYEQNKLNGPGKYINFEEKFIRNYGYTNDTLDGRVSEVWFNDTLKLEYTSRMGNYEGPYRAFYPNGNPEILQHFTNDKKTGKWSEYYYNGQLSREGEYNNEGNLVGSIRSYDRNGKLMADESDYENDKLTGYYTRYFPEGNVQIRRYYRNDSLRNSESFDASGKLLYQSEANGDSLYIKTYYADGVLMEEGWLVHGKNQGCWKKYNPLGILSEERNYLAGIQTGHQYFYFPSGQVSKVYDSDSSYMMGFYKEYYPSGQLQITGTYCKEGPDGAWTSYYENDTVYARSFYIKGTPRGRAIYYHYDGRIHFEEFYNEEGDIVRTVIYDNTGHIESDWQYAYGTHRFISYYPNGKIKSVTNLSDNVKHGLQETYYPNGQLATRLDYLHGAPNGTYTRYDYKGNIEASYTYLLGKLNGDFRTLTNGSLDYHARYENDLNQGKIYSYHYNGKLARELDLVDDDRHGFSDYYCADGNFMYRIRYAYGSIKGYTYKNQDGKFVPEIPVNKETKQIVTYYPNGKVSANISLKNGLYHGRLTTYYNTGKIQYESDFMNDDNHGIHKEYFPDGRLREELNYLYDERHGPYTLYDAVGSVLLKGNYLDHARHGEWIVCDSNGKVTEKLYYDHGELFEIVQQ
ncbi:MAG: tetratricopeptide repeat protein [Bacteroidales bacterium]|nr:tetratricopeptide repeat protein [Bacteroidales bacterium]